MEQPTATVSAIHIHTLSERTAHKVSYAQDLLEQPDEYDTIKANSVKGSRAGSVYYSATDSVAQSLSASVNQSMDLDDSDADFELEVADEPEPSAKAHDKAGGMSSLISSNPIVCCV